MRIDAFFFILESKMLDLRCLFFISYSENFHITKATKSKALCEMSLYAEHKNAEIGEEKNLINQRLCVSVVKVSTAQHIT